MGLNYENYVVVDPKFYRPTDVHVLTGDYSKAKETLGWEPKIRFEGLVHRMVDNDAQQLGIKLNKVL